jgi:hypothetical protein
LNTDLTDTSDHIKPWELFAGSLTDAGIEKIVPIGVPGEYSKLEIWIVSQATIVNQTEPILSVWGRQAIPDAAQNNMPHAYDSTNYPKVSEWWNPLVFADRAVDRLNSSTSSIGSGIPHTAISGATGAVNGTGSYQMQALKFTLNQRAAHVASADLMTFAEMMPIMNVFVLVAGAVWSVAKITAAVTTLTASVNRLEQSVDKMERRLCDHETRLSHLEASRS